MADSLPPPTPGSAAELARAIRLHVYRHFAQTGGAPSPVQIARSFQLTPSQAERVLQRLASEADALVGELHLGRAGHPGPAPGRRLGPDRMPRLRR